MPPHSLKDGSHQVDERYLTWENTDEQNLVNTHFDSLDTSHEPNSKRRKANTITNPFAWSPRYKLYLAILGGIANFSTTYAGGSYTSATNPMAAEWNVSSTAVLVGVTLYTIAFAIAPMVLAPLSEQMGRWPIVTISGVVFVIGVLFCAVTRLYVGMLLARVLVGMASSTFAVIIVGVVADIYDSAEKRYVALTLFTGGAMFGNGFGPLVSGFIVQNTSWRWVFGVFDVFVAVMVVVLATSYHETRSAILLQKKAKALNGWYGDVLRMADTTKDRQNSGDDEKSEPSLSEVRWKVEGAEQRKNLAVMIKTSLTKPLRLLLTEPVVFWFSCWASFAWSIMYALLVVVPYTFQKVYDFDLQTSSAVFAAMCIGTLIMMAITPYHDRICRLLLPQERYNSPEGLLYPVAIESILLPAGIFWYGWAAQTGTHWIVPALGLACATMGMFSVYLAVFAYLATAYKQYASSANAAQSMMRNLIGGSFPLFSRAMFQRLGFGGACSLLGGIGIVLTFVPWVLIAFGPKIRARSKFAFSENI